MKTKTIEIEIPETLDETEFKEWCVIKFERHLRSLEEAKTQPVSEIIKPDLESIREANGILKVAEKVIAPVE